MAAWARARSASLDALVAGAGEPLLGALAGQLRAVHVDVLGGLGRVGEDGDVVAVHLKEAAADGEGGLVVAAPEDELAVVERRHEGGMARQDRQLALAAGGDEHLDVLFGADDALGGDDLDEERH